MNKEMSKRQQIGRQQVAPAAFEIRFSTTDSQGVELVEIPPPDLDPQERSIPDPFKKRDKIPRNSGSGSTIEGLAQNVSMPPSRLSGNDNQSTPVTNKHVLPKNKSLKDSNNTSSNGFDTPIKAKSWNSVVPEVEKQGKFGDSMEVDETTVNLNSTEKRNKVEDESASRHVQGNKKRPLPVEENGSDKENGFSTKDASAQSLAHSINNKDLYVTAETVASTNKEHMIKNNNKNRKTSMTTEIKDDDIRTVSRPTDGIATPPATPPSSPPIAPQGPQSSTVDVPQAPSKTKEIPPLPSPPSTTGSPTVNDSTQSLVTPSRIPRPSPSRPIITAYLMELQEEQEQQELEDQEEQERQEQEEEQDQQEREEREEQVRQECEEQVQQERGEQVQQEQEEQAQQEQEDQQTKGHSRRRPTISHDDMIIPTIAKKLKMNGQLPYPNHDALLGISDEQDLSSENVCINATNQVENLLGAEQQKLPERHSSVPELQQRKASISSKIPVRNRKDSKRINHHAQVEEILDPVDHVPKSEEDKKRKRKSRREEYVLVVRDEDEEDEFGNITEQRSSMSLTPSEPSMSTTTTLLPSERDSAEHEQINIASSSTQSAQQGANIPSSSIQLAVPNKTSPSPLTLELERTYTSDPNEKKPKRQKKNKNRKSKETVVDEDDVRKSACCCIIC